MKKEVGLMERISFSSFIGGQKLMYILVTTYATLYFYSIGLNLVFVTALIFGTRIFDAVNDPIIGAWIDKSKIKLKVYITLTAVALPVFSFLLFVIPNMGIMTYIIVTVLYVLWSILYTISEVPIYSVVSRMTKSVKEQNAIFSNSMLGSLVGSILGMVLIGIFVKDGVDNIPWALMAVSLSVLGLIQMVLTVIFVKERYTVKEEEQPQTIREGLKTVLKNKHLMTIMFLFMAQLFMNASSVFALYVFDGYYGTPALGSISGIVSMIVIIPLAFTLSMLISKLGKTWLIYIASGCMIVSNIVILLLGSTNLGMTLLPVLIIVSTVGVVIPSLLRPLYTQETIDHYKKHGGKVSTAGSFSMMTFFNKAGDALGSGLGSLLLIFVGFDSALELSEQDPSIFSSLHILWALGPILMGLVWFIGIKYFYKLKHVKQIEFDIEPLIAKDVENLNEI